MYKIVGPVVEATSATCQHMPTTDYRIKDEEKMRFKLLSSSSGRGRSRWLRQW